MKQLLRALLFMVIPFLIVACSSGSTSDTTTGSIAFQLTWDASAVPSAHRAPPAGADVCVWYQIDTVNVIIYNSSNAQIKSNSWPCSAHSGSISGIPVGTVSVRANAIVAGNTDWTGQATGIVVTANQTTNAGTITMSYMGNDIVDPTVQSVTPLDGAVDVALDTTVTATFSEDVVIGSVTDSTFLLDGGTAVTGAVTYNSGTHTATFVPGAQLSPSTLYTATITTGVEDLAGRQLAANYVWSFTTGVAPDTVAPTVTTPTSPADSATGVSVNTVIQATFSEAMDPATIDTSTFTVDNGVTGTVTYDAGTMTATFTPSVALNNDTVYTATITTGATDLAGNPLDADYIWSFTTEPVGATTGTWDVSTWDNALWDL